LTTSSHTHNSQVVESQVAEIASRTEETSHLQTDLQASQSEGKALEEQLQASQGQVSQLTEQLEHSLQVRDGWHWCVFCVGMMDETAYSLGSKARVPGVPTDEAAAAQPTGVGWPALVRTFASAQKWIKLQQLSGLKIKGPRCPNRKNSCRAAVCEELG